MEYHWWPTSWKSIHLMFGFQSFKQDFRHPWVSNNSWISGIQQFHVCFTMCCWEPRSTKRPWKASLSGYTGTTGVGGWQWQTQPLPWKIKINAGGPGRLGKHISLQRAKNHLIPGILATWLELIGKFCWWNGELIICITLFPPCFIQNLAVVSGHHWIGVWSSSFSLGVNLMSTSMNFMKWWLNLNDLN